MTLRTPLRPLTRILRAREHGENPDAIERENLRLRHEAMRDKMRQRAETRLLLLAMCFFAAFITVGLRMSTLAASEPEEPRIATSGSAILNTRADIVDRQGRVLATNLVTNSLYAHPHEIIDPATAARGLAQIFPDLDEETLLRRFTSDSRFIWLRRYISPEQEQLVHDLGEPGLLFGPREMRLYPNGSVAAHILGGAGFGEEAVNAAEVIGVAGVEARFDDALRDPARDGAPLELSIDLTVQAAVEQVLAGGMVIMNARGASAVLMDVHTGEIRAMASLPDFDPNARPAPLTEGEQADSPLFNRALQGVYELGSVFKMFTVAQALNEGMVNPETIIDTAGPLRMAGFSISDFRNYGSRLSVTEVMIHSSNIGTARIAQMLGAERQQRFLEQLGFFQPTLVEMIEAPSGRPLLPQRWGELTTMTVSYGHGLSTSPIHLAAAYASITNGGTLIRPTLLLQDGPQNGERIVSEEVSEQIRSMLRDVVTEGTASFGDVEGYAVGGKTGSADKPRPNGGYYEDRVLSTFASVFPAHDPRYVLIVTLDEPEIVALGEARRTAGWTAVPVAAEVIRRVAPLLGLRPEIEPQDGFQLSSASE
ncbi:penicillin-binding protein 2 [Roseobacter sp. HKCCD9010]|uniref:peptidoglycan D,D-transpeptidase FtsI family protein n=1 Tax=unclassified Roseobacter TaxID=196798 RepID=UPI00149250C8|nr:MULTISPECIES: penicillin-binding protein 2 [unclassified Roseobacter]MBF9049517.1 penicillin-binding protein 2 [Rhodobacterales bacterium HKCCD4356]NNV11517.1 penicillin-binding protein 2 [Roseobacter sp. HKCCD7357]NNV15701.1 penicillin-binding protein 2 [Roseobacter sp. HKCCD8768]NNV25161.1 penicillin-binding protein 2 [Roseobacter sp. HKCCD8192]NNV29418.1 penicillin-binding protein 2 [Roseobacter sp. HKCCD9061]